jgi:OOP family OmpA-OmpF porin
MQTATVSDSLNSILKKDQNLYPGVMTINFAFDKSGFSPDKATDNYFEKSKAFIANNTEARLSIIGYTDSVGSDSYNMSLGFRRAQSLKDYFERKGITDEKIKVESKGEREPADENNTISGRANNRRTVITIKN